MLSGIQKYLEKNRKWLFGFLLVVIIVPFVFTIGSMPGLGYSKKKNHMKIFDCDLGNPQEAERAVRDGALSIALHTASEENAWMESAQGYAIYRLLLLHIAKEIHYPKPNEEVLYDYIKTLPLFFDKDKKFDPKSYNNYLAKWSERFGKTQNLRQLIEGDYVCDQIRKIVQQPAFVMPKAIEQLYQHWKTEFHLRYLVLENNLKVPENISELQVKEFFEQHKNAYRMDRRADVAILFFENNKHRSQLGMISDEELQKYFNEHKKSFVEKGKSIDEVNFVDVKPRVLAAVENIHLKDLSEKCATQFILTAYDQELTFGSDAWKVFVDKNDVRIIDTLAPYTEKNMPKKKGLSRKLLAKAFDLDSDHFLSDPYPVKNGYAVLALKRMLPSYQQELNDVREQVIADAKEDERQQAFKKQSEVLREKLIQPNANVDEIVAANKLSFKVLEPFSLNNAFFELSKVLEFNALLDFMKLLDGVKSNQWLPLFPGKKNQYLLFQCTQSKEGSVDVNSDGFKDFAKSFEARQSQIHGETLFREIIEDTMNNMNPKKR